MTTYRIYTNPASAVDFDVQQIAGAQRTIDFAAYTLTEQNIIQALYSAAHRGVAIRLYMDRSEITAEAKHDDTGTMLPIHPLIGAPNVTIKVKHSIILMHLKSYLVDGVTLRSGSANWSPLGECQQDNEASWESDPALATEFAQKFESMWNRTDNLTVAQAVDLNAAQQVVSTHQNAHAATTPGFPGFATKNASK